MNCESLRRTVLLEDDDLRPDTAGLRAHYANCLVCRSAFPELALVLPVARRTLSRPQHARVAAAAALLLAAALALHRNALDHPQAPDLGSAPDRSRALAYTLVVESSVAERDRVTTSKFTHRTQTSRPFSP